MEINHKLKNFINENIDLIDENNKEAWEEIYNKLSRSVFPKGEFTQTILNSGINDPASIMRYIPKKYLIGSTIESYIIPSDVTSISEYAFFDCKSLMNVTIPDSILSIGYEAFCGCSNLKKIVIPGSVTRISEHAFAWCENLTSVVIPDSVISIGEAAFTFCTNLKEIQYKGTKKQAITKLKVKNKSWREQSTITKIICSDGIIEL